MLQSSIENSEGLKDASQNNMYELAPQEGNCSLISSENRQKIDGFSGELVQASSRGSFSLDSQQISTEDYSQANSIEQGILTEHLTCLQYEKLFKIEYDFNRIEPNTSVYLQHESSLQQYLLADKSLIPDEFIQHFVKFLQKHVSFRRALEWVYHHAQPQLGDELILIAHKVLLAYLPIKHLIHSREQIAQLVRQPFNLHNIYNDSRLQMLNIDGLWPLSRGTLQFKTLLYAFHQEYLQTLLLVLEQYFQNPGYLTALQEQQKRYNKMPTHSNAAMVGKKKKIHKISRGL